MFLGPKRFLSRLLPLAILAGLAGCGVTQNMDGQTVHYTNAGGSIWVTFFVGLTITAAGVVLFVVSRRWEQPDARRKTKKSLRPQHEDSSTWWLGSLSWAALFGGGFVLVGMVPGIFFASVTVTPDEAIINDSAIWFLPNRATVRFAEVLSVSPETRERWTRRGLKTTDYLVFALRNGTTKEVEIGPLVRAAEGRIQENLQMHHARNQTPVAQVPHPGIPNPAVPQDPVGNKNPAIPDAPPLQIPMAPMPNPPRQLPKEKNNPPGNVPKRPISLFQPGFPVTDKTAFQPGMWVFVEIEGRWRHASVIGLKNDGSVDLTILGTGKSLTVPRSHIRLFSPRVKQ